tara:strand:- start:19252 stop:22083 length:2832 start_codon:yes stop_codon:yes gene_type:complete
MPTDRIRFIDPDATGGGTGVDLANAYTDAINALAGEIGTPNLVTADERLVFECHSSAGGQVTTTHSVSTTWTTDYSTGNYILFRPYTGNRAGAEWDATKFTFNPSANPSSSVTDDWRDVVYDGLQVDCSQAGVSQILFKFLSGGSDRREIKGCYLRYSGTGGSGNLLTSYASDIDFRFSNNIIDGWPARMFSDSRNGGTYYYSDNTFVNNTAAISKTGSGTSIAKGNLFYNTTTPFTGTFAAGTDYNSTDQVSLGYTVTGGGNANDRLSQTFTFVSGTDYAITVGDTGAYQLGVDLSADGLYPIVKDIRDLDRVINTSIGVFDPDAIDATRPLIDVITDPIVDGGTITLTGTNLDLTTSFILSNGTVSQSQALTGQTATNIGPSTIVRGDLPFTDINQTIVATVTDGINPQYDKELTFNPANGFQLVTALNIILDNTSLFSAVTGGTPIDGDQLVVPDTSFNGHTVEYFSDGLFNITGGTGNDQIDNVEYWDSTLESWSGPVTIFITGDVVDTIAPVFTAGPSISNVATTSYSVDFTTDESGTYRFISILDSDVAPTVEEVLAGQSSGGGAPVFDSTLLAMTLNTPVSTPATGQASGASYDVYVAVQDPTGNSRLASVIKVTTTISNSAPIVTPPDNIVISFPNGGSGLPKDNSVLLSWIATATVVDDNDILTATADLSGLTDPIPQGTHTITFSATDSGGLTDSAQSNLTVVEAAGGNTAPIVTAPNDVSLQYPNGSTGLSKTDTVFLAWLATATVVDDSDTLTATADLSGLADPIPQGSYTITFTATDTEGLVGTDIAVLTLSEQTSPGLVIETSDVDLNFSQPFKPNNLEVERVMVNGEYGNVIRISPQEDISSNTNTLILRSPKPNVFNKTITIANGLTLGVTTKSVNRVLFVSNEYVEYIILENDIIISGEWSVCLHSLTPSGKMKILGPLTFSLDNC